MWFLKLLKYKYSRFPHMLLWIVEKRVFLVSLCASINSCNISIRDFSRLLSTVGIQVSQVYLCASINYWNKLIPDFSVCFCQQLKCKYPKFFYVFLSTVQTQISKISQCDSINCHVATKIFLSHSIWFSIDLFCKYNVHLFFISQQLPTHPFQILGLLLPLCFYIGLQLPLFLLFI
jgi:hypothetical protein